MKFVKGHCGKNYLGVKTADPMIHPIRILLLLFFSACCGFGELPNAEISGRSFVDQAQIVSNYLTEQYAHQSSMRIVKGIGYAVYQCSEVTPEENKAGQIARMAVFNILNPTAKWVDVAAAGDSTNGITIASKFVAAPMLHRLDDDTLRIFFTASGQGDAGSMTRVFFKDYTISTATLSGLHQACCSIAKQPDKVIDLTQTAVQSHLDFLFGSGFGESFAKGISTACDFVEFDDQLYSTIQIKNSEDGKTLLLTNVLMRSADQGATWELLGAPDPRLLSTEVKILAEAAITQDKEHIWLHLRSNVVESGYLLSKASKSDLYSFDTPIKKWTDGIGRPTICDFGRPIGFVAMFTAQSVPMGGAAVSRNKCEVVQIDSSHSRYKLAFSVLDYNAVNTPFMHRYNDEVYVTYSTGRRHLLPKFGTPEIVFSKLRREFFVPTQTTEP